MLSKEDAKKYLQMLGQELYKQQLTGEILLADGVVVFFEVGQPEPPQDSNAYRNYLKGEGPPTERRKDINAYVKGHGAAMYKAAADIAKAAGLPEPWLNDAIQMLFYSSSSHLKWLEYPGLRIYLSSVEYALALKVAAADSQQDAEDIRTLINTLRISDRRHLLTLVTKYLPEQLLAPQVKLTIEQSITF
ncbi:MAG: hypothetical protein JO125_06500 [Chloroflexi bacterium]|nr:hypothetical protein [Chloroflexota bacterium]